MVFRRRRGGRRGKFRKFKRRGKFSVKRVAKRVRRIEKSIETKYLDITATTQAVSNAGYIREIGGTIVQGTSEIGQRVGMEIVATSMDIRFHCEVPLVAVTGDNYNRIRVIVGWDKMPQGSGLPALADILETVTTPDMIVANRQWNLRKRFRTLYDKVFTLYAPQSGGALTAGSIRYLFKQLHFKLKRRKIIYLDNSGGAASIDKNMLVILFVSDSIAVTHPVVTFDARLKYQDL